MLPNARSYAQSMVKPNKPKYQSLEQRKVYYRAMQGEGGLCPQNPKPSKNFSRLVKGQQGRSVISCCKLLGVESLCCCSCPRNNVPFYLQQDKCNLSCSVIVCLGSVIFYLYMDGFFKVKALRMGSPVCFRLWAAFFYERCRASMTKQATEHKG